MSPVLRINTVLFGPASDGQRRITVTWQDGPIPWQAVSSFRYQVDEQDAERIRWYLEDYAEYPADPAPSIALDTEQRLAQIGTDLFRLVFSGQDAAGIWAQARNRLSQVRLEVDSDPADTPGLPWELLRDPAAAITAALDAGAFVRTHLQAAVHPVMPESAGDRLRVLLVICRPGGREDVPFRSVASRLVRGGADKMTGMDLDVLRPATFGHLSKVLREAAAAGRPYHVVHFDGHGTFVDVADLEPGDQAVDGETGSSEGGAGGGLPLSPLYYGLSVAGPVRPGQHGYLLFENPARPDNQQLVDGPILGRLLTAAQVPVLVLNACRSAYTEAPDHPVMDSPQPGGQIMSGAAGSGDDGPAEVPMDVHGRIRAYGSLAAEVADAGVPGVVAMRYNVYVVTAAQFAADLYAHLLAGSSLGQAATAARRALADNPARQIGATPVALQDWAVPVVYEAAPLALLEPETRHAPVILLSASDSSDPAEVGGGLPRPPDAGFFGRDETLLALDRAFDNQRVVLLHGYAGAGKSSTAAEFARWYVTTGGLDYPGHSDREPGPVLWSSFEHYLSLDRLLDAAGDQFSELLEANGLHWQAITSPARRRSLVLQVLAQVPALWIWDNIEPVTGFPAGASSDWTTAERDALAGFLRDLAEQTMCKVLLTSRRDERTWLGGLPARFQLPSMPMRERLQLAAAIAERHGHVAVEADWRPLLRFSAGNPLTITVLVGQALRENLTASDEIQAFIERLRAGEAELEPGEDAALGRTRSLAASLSYGFTRAFTDAQRSQLAVLHLFRDTVDVDVLRSMGNPDIAGVDAVPQLAGMTRDMGIALLDQATDIGLLASLGGGYYTIHPALPWYFDDLFTHTFSEPGHPDLIRPARAYTCALAILSGHYSDEASAGNLDRIIPVLRAEEANLRNALALAQADQDWANAVRCLAPLTILYQYVGRISEWSRLVAEITPAVTDAATDQPLAGQQEIWSIITTYRIRLAMRTRDWPTATRLQQAAVTWSRQVAAGALAAPATQLTFEQRTQLENLVVDLKNLGEILWQQGDPGCLAPYEEALDLCQRTGTRKGEADVAINLGAAYELPGLRDLDKAEHWYRHSLDLRAEDDLSGRAASLSNLGDAAYERYRDARDANSAEDVLLGYLNTALQNYRQALSLTPADAHEKLANYTNQIGNVYSAAGQRRYALDYYQQSIQHEEAQGNIYGAGQTRYNVALLLRDGDRPGDALQYARAALQDFQRVEPGTAKIVLATQQLIAGLEREIKKDKSPKP